MGEAALTPEREAEIRRYLKRHGAAGNWTAGARRAHVLLAEIDRLREALHQEGHHATFGDDHWGIEHPVACRREGLHNCPLNAAMDALIDETGGRPVDVGRYPVSLGDDGNLVIGERVPEGGDRA